MTENSLVLHCADVDLRATVTLPSGGVRGAIALLHPSQDPSRDQFLFRHLADMLPGRGIAVLRYDRRPVPEDADVPYERQVADLRVGLAALAAETGPVPTGLWGFSQGAWVGLLAAAADPTIAFLAVVGCSAVSPARQMRYGTAEQLRRAGFGDDDLTELAALRTAWESYQRGELGREQAQLVVDRFTGRSWFPLAWVPADLPAGREWDDMDFDPVAAIRRLRCPVLAFYGDDEWVPVAESIDVWRHELPDPAGLTVCHLPGTDHHPTLGGGRTAASVSPLYSATLTDWLDKVLLGAEAVPAPLSHAD